MGLNIGAAPLTGGAIGNTPLGGAAIGSTVIWPTTAPPPITPRNRPTQPSLLLWQDSGGGGSAVTQYAQPGCLVCVGRQNYAAQYVKDLAAGGATVVVYIDPIITTPWGRYHTLLHSASEFGPAAGRWRNGSTEYLTGSNPGASEPTYLANFRPGSILQSKLGPVLNAVLDANPWLSGWMLDDVGTRSWFGGFNWSNWSTADKQAYRDGAIQICQTARNVADQRRNAGKGDCMIFVNGTWGGGTVTSNGGGYPTVGTHGCSLVDGGIIENHSPSSELAYWRDYSNGPNWATGTPRRIPYHWTWNTSTSDRDGWRNASIASHAYSGSRGAVSTAPFSAFTDLGMPRRLTW